MATPDPDPLENPLPHLRAGSAWAAPAALFLLAAGLWAFLRPHPPQDKPPAPPVAESAPVTAPATESPNPGAAPHGHEINLKRLTILLPTLSPPAVRYSDEPPSPLPSRSQLEKLFAAYDTKIRQALLAQWRAPMPGGATVLDVVHATFTFSSDGAVQRAKITEPSHSPELNGSVEELLHEYANGPGPLPATLMDESYELEAEFRVY